MRKLGFGLIAVVLSLFNINLCAQRARVLAPHKPVTPKIDVPQPSPRAAILRSLVGGFWMVGPDLKATIHLSNDVATNPISVTPILHLSSGQAVALPTVQLAPSGMAVVSIDEGLAHVAVDLTKPLYGYLEVQYTWSWDAICASIKDIDTAHSLIFIYTLEPLQKPKMHTPIPTVALMQDNVLEGFWWKQEPGVTGFVAISNVLATPANANIVVSDDANSPIASHTVAVPGHGTAVVNLAELDSAPGPQGGVHITYDGPTDGLEINGGLEDPATGFSAHLPLHFPPIAAAQHAGLSYAALDLMNGAADPNMSFPVGTSFTPYAVARNISNQPLTVTPTLWWMVGIVPHSARLSSVTIAPYQTVNLNPPALLEAAGLKDFVGSFNLEVETDGQSRALLEATGSVDQTNNYVFEETPIITMESVAKALSYWSTGNGDNTMVTLWNPADEPQSLKFVLHFAGGDGKYSVPIYLNGRETRSFNISTIINNPAADSDGNTIPPGTYEGRAEIMGANGENEHILVAMSEGVYNVQKATCGNQYCQTCQGAVDAWILANPFSVASGGNTGLTFTVQYKSGTQYNHTSIATWTSSNSSVATVNAGTVTGVSPGAVSMVADDTDVPDYSYTCYYSNPDSVCPAYTGASASGGGDVNLSVTFSSLPYVAIGQTAQISANVAPQNNTVPISLSISSPASIVSPIGNITQSTNVIVKGLSAGTATLTATAQYSDGSRPSWSTSFPVIPSISGSNTVWWFKGLNPASSTYPVSVTLTSSAGSSTSWSVSQPDSKVNLSASTGAQITVSSTGQYFSAQNNDISITATSNGMSSAPFTLTAKTPWKLVAVSNPNNDTNCNPSPQSYFTLLQYNLIDNLNITMTTDITWNEVVAPAVCENGSNWCNFAIVTSPGSTNPVIDVLSPPTLNQNPSPTPTCTGSALGTTRYRSASQTISVGTTTAGSGVVVQTDYLGYYGDHGQHDSKQSPGQPPQ